MGRRDRDERDAGPSPAVTPDYSAPINTSAPTTRDPVRNTQTTGHSGPATTPTTKSQPGIGGVKTGNPDAGPANSISSSYGDSHTGSISTGKIATAPDPIAGGDYRPGIDGPSWSEYIDRTRPDPVGPGEYGPSGDPNPIGVYTGGDTNVYDPRDSGPTRGGTHTTTTKVSTGRPTRGNTLITGTSVQDPDPAPDKTKNVCKPRPKDNRPKGGGGGGKRGFIPWCS